jgi:hypothetical protein
LEGRQILCQVEIFLRKQLGSDFRNAAQGFVRQKSRDGNQRKVPYRRGTRKRGQLVGKLLPDPILAPVIVGPSTLIGSSA